MASSSSCAPLTYCRHGTPPFSFIFLDGANSCASHPTTAYRTGGMAANLPRPSGTEMVEMDLKKPEERHTYNFAAGGAFDDFDLEKNNRFFGSDRRLSEKKKIQSDGYEPTVHDNNTPHTTTDPVVLPIPSSLHALSLQRRRMPSSLRRCLSRSRVVQRW